MSLKFKNYNGTKIGMSLKLESHLNWNVAKIGMWLKSECH